MTELILDTIEGKIRVILKMVRKFNLKKSLRRSVNILSLMHELFC